MRTMILALAVILLAAPAWATVYITATDEGGGVVAIDYSVVSEPNLVRAFGLDITVTEGNIVDCCDYAVGDDNYGYGIFPGTFGVLTVNAGTGQVETWDVNTYTPASVGLDTNWVTIEMGSLYDTNSPGDVGLLCRVTCDTTCKLSVTLNALSGGVVMEDANDPVGIVDVTGATDVDVTVGVPDCFPSGYTTYANWVLYGKPDCWCGKGTGVTSIPEADLGYQCDGDADHATFGFKKYRVFTPDLNILIANWMKYDVDNLTKPVEERLPGDCPRPE